MTLPIDAKINIIAAVIDDYIDYIDTNGYIPSEKKYKIISSDEGRMVKQAAREAALENLIPSPMVKLAFDTRRIDQESTRNPRTNLQYWHRAQQFIEEADENKLKTFTKLANLLTKLKSRFGTSPEWFESYARQLYDNVNRIIRIKEGDLDIFRPQLAYLEQLIYARYRLSMENIDKFSDENLQNCILAKDEPLIGRNNYLKEVISDDDIKKDSKIVKDSLEKNTQESIINAIFGSNNNIRRDGERSVERIITISIRDNVID
jgi:hypothetical protein